MIDAQHIVEEFMNAYYRGDNETARTFLADEFSFVGPVAAFDSADGYLRTSGHVAPRVINVEKRKVFVEESDVCVFYDLQLSNPEKSVPVAEWYHFENERISAIRMIFNAAAFT